MELTVTRTCLTEAGARRSRRFKKGTVVYTNSGDTLGVPRILGMDACANDGVAASENLSHEVDPRFLCFFLRSITRAIRENARQGSGQPNLNTEIVKSIRFALPPLAEQRAIAAHLAERNEAIGALAEEAERAIAVLRERRTSLISAAVTGQMDVQRRHDREVAP